MKMRILSAAMGMTVCLTGCAGTASITEESSAVQETRRNETQAYADSTQETSEAAEPEFASAASEMFTNRDYEVGYDESSTYHITLSGDTAVSDSDAVDISGNVITITGEGTYIVTGTLDDGMLVVDTDETAKPQIVLDGADITSSTSAPLYIKSANKVFVTLAGGTENTLANGGVFEAFDDNNIDAAVFSKQDITFNGSGSLAINSPAGHGIAAKDDIAVTSGTYSIICGAHGINANNSIRLANADMNIDSGNDGIHAEHNEDASLGFVYALSGTYTINSAGDGMSAGSYMQIENGTYNIVSGGGSVNAEEKTPEGFGRGMIGGGPGGMMVSGRHGYGAVSQTAAFGMTAAEEAEADDTSVSTKGMKAADSILMNGGAFTIDSADDSVHSDGTVTINGGKLTITSGDDGIHANETLTVNDGTIDITESYEGLEGLDILITGGEIKLRASDDGFNAAGGTDSSGFGGMGGGNDMFGGHGGMMGQGSASGGSIIISGGDIYMNAYGDGIDSNGTLEISGGDVTVCGPTNGDTAVLDYDREGIITGGTFIGSGSHMMAQTFSSSEQGVLAVSVGEQAAGTTVTVTDDDGDVVIETTPELPFEIIILSCKKLKSGKTYTLTIGDESAEMIAG